MEAPKITKELLGGLVLTSCVSLLIELDIFRCRFVLCVCPGLCKYVSIYTARSMCCCMFAPFCLRVYLSLFLAILCCPPPHTQHSLHTHTHTHTHTLELRHNSHTHTHTLPTSMCVPSLFFALTSCLVSLQSRKASDQTKSIESKTDSIGSGRAIPIKQVRDRIRTLMIWGKYTVIGVNCRPVMRISQMSIS